MSAPIAEILETARKAHAGGHLDEAEAQYRTVLAAEPGHAEVTGLMGALYAQRNDFENAEGWLKQAIALDPAVAAPFYNLARVQMQMGRPQEALANCDRVLALYPEYLPARAVKANALAACGQIEAALAEYGIMTAQAPQTPMPHYQRGQMLAGLGRWQEAIQSYDRALAIKFDGPIHAARGIALHSLLRYEEASAAYRNALLCTPNDAGTWFNLGHVLMAMNDTPGALRAYNNAYALDPRLPTLAGNRWLVKTSVCDWSDYLADRAVILEGVVRGEPAALNLIGIEAPPILQQACARISAAQYINRNVPALWRGERYNHQRPRIAYISSDFREHAVSIVSVELFERHDRNAFEIFGISHSGKDNSPIRKRMEAAFEHFHDVHQLDERAIAELLRSLEIDIVVDMNGYTRDARLGIFSHRPAPLSVTFLGYAGTLGSPLIDYIVADRIVVPEEDAQFYDEHVITMPDSFMANARRSVASAVPTRRAAGLPETGFVFCAFIHPSKIRPYMFDIWMRLLTEIEGSVLWLSSMPALARENLQREAGARGVDAARLIFAPHLAAFDMHMARLSLADIFLDTLPYNGHSTTADALYAGVPVVTCRGDAFPGRVATSLLQAIGLDELSTESFADYEALALALARDPERLGALKARLLSNRDTTPLFDNSRFARNLEKAYRHMLERHQSGEAPAGFTV
jgi:predicted O-linked N-acetylglucosamine transferase (SPINDLY family)